MSKIKEDDHMGAESAEVLRSCKQSADEKTKVNTGLSFPRAAFIAALSGVAYAFGFIPVEIPPLSIFAVAALAWISNKSSPRQAGLCGWLFYMVVLLVGCGWIFQAVGPIGIILMMAASLFTAMGLYLYVFVSERLKVPDGFPRAVFFATCWTAFEFIRAEIWPMKNASHALGFVVPDGPWLMLARWLGVFGITFLLALLAALLQGALFDRGYRRFCTIGMFLGILLISWSLGTWSCLVPPDVGKPVALRYLQLDAVSLEKHIAVSKEALVGASSSVVLLWPENVRRNDLLSDQKSLAQLKSFCKKYKAGLILGARKKTIAGELFNTAFAFNAEGKHAGDFSKRNPVPLIESKITPSKDGGPVSLFGVKWGPAICYDADFASVARELVDLGAQVLVTPTRDAPSWGKNQHMQRARMLRLRAVETGRWWVRVSCDGPSFVMDPKGCIVGPVLSVGARGWAGGRVWPRNERTPYVRFGWLIPWFALVGAFVPLLIALLKRRKACC